MITGKTAKEELLLPTDEQRAPEDCPRARGGLRRGERQLRQRAQTQRGHHSPQVRPLPEIRAVIFTAPTVVLRMSVLSDLLPEGSLPVQTQP